MRSSTIVVLVGALGCSSPAVAPDATVADVAPADAADAPAVDFAPMCPPLPTPGMFVPGRARAHSMDAVLRMNHLQAKTTHNSYHLQPAADLVDWAYSHRPLDEQLEAQGVRGVELDLQWEEDCGRLEVFHVPVVDARTTCRVFTDCLTSLREWSRAHPGHHPIFVHIEPKWGEDPARDDARLDQMDREILSVFSRSWIVTPDEVQGSAATLREAVGARGWPTLGEARGRFVFYLDDHGNLRDRYTHGRRDLRGRVLFADGDRTDGFVAVRILNGPMEDAAEIRSAVAAGMIVRTRADSSPATARANDTAQREAALTSGAQLITTDFPAPVMGLTYSVTLPGGTPSRCAPNAPAGCTARAIEDPALLAP